MDEIPVELKVFDNAEAVLVVVEQGGVVDVHAVVVVVRPQPRDSSQFVQLES